MRKALLFLPLILLGIITVKVAEGQTDIEVGLFVGDSYYIGDLNPYTPFKMAQLAYGFNTRYILDDRWAVKLAITQGKVKGDSEKTGYLPGRNLQFESPVTDISLMAEFNFFPYFTGSKYNWITPYLYGGIGWFFFQPSSGGVSLQPLGTEGQNVGYEGRKPYATNGLQLPFGIGVKISLSKKFALTAYWEMHKTFTDYIDDVSSTYYLNGPAILPGDVAGTYSDPTRSHTPGMQRGNPNSKDWYSFSGVTIAYKFTLRRSGKCRDNKHF